MKKRFEVDCGLDGPSLSWRVRDALYNTLVKDQDGKPYTFKFDQHAEIFAAAMNLGAAVADEPDDAEDTP